MGLADRRAARQGVQSAEDRELKGYIDEAKRALDKAVSVCRRISSDARQGATPRTPEEAKAQEAQRYMASKAKQNVEVLRNVLGQLESLAGLQATLDQDIDLLPVSVRTEMSRKSLRERVAANSQRRLEQTERAVSRVLASIEVNK